MQVVNLALDPSHPPSRHVHGSPGSATVWVHFGPSQSHVDSITPQGPSTACFIQTAWGFQSQPEPQSFPITPILPSPQPPATPASPQDHCPHPRPTLPITTRLGLWGSLLGH